MADEKSTRPELVVDQVKLDLMPGLIAQLDAMAGLPMEERIRGMAAVHAQFELDVDAEKAKRKAALASALEKLEKERSAWCEQMAVAFGTVWGKVEQQGLKQLSRKADKPLTLTIKIATFLDDQGNLVANPPHVTFGTILPTRGGAAGRGGGGKKPVTVTGLSTGNGEYESTQAARKALLPKVEGNISFDTLARSIRAKGGLAVQATTTS